MTHFERHLQAAQGYLELRLPEDALAELDAVEEKERMDLRVLGLRASIFEALGRWEDMWMIATMLCEARPDEAQWPVSLAFATRRQYGLERAMSVLMEAVHRFPEEPIIHYNLACYEAQLGNLRTAWLRLNEAIRLSPRCRELALTDPDLAVLRAEMESLDR